MTRCSQSVKFLCNCLDAILNLFSSFNYKMVTTQMTWHSRPWVPGHSLLFDIRYQYALHTTSFKEQHIFKNRLIKSTVSRLIEV